jgi:hypothetical protein
LATVEFVWIRLQLCTGLRGYGVVAVRFMHKVFTVGGVAGVTGGPKVF